MVATPEFAKRSSAAFTLLELSVVLVIIGLIVGGVLVGKDLIKAAEVRAAISQIEKYNAAALTFRNKYNGLPGDLSNAAQFGWTVAQGTGGWGGTPANVIGNGLINSCMDDYRSLAIFSPYGYVGFGCENAMLWVELSSAGLISENFTFTANATGFTNTSSSFESYTPRSKLPENYITVSAWSGVNWFNLHGIGLLFGNNNGSINAINKISPNVASHIDTKMDDGLPISGAVLANDYSDGLLSGGNFRVNLTSGSSSVCRNASDQYNTGGSAATDSLCQLRIRAGF